MDALLSAPYLHRYVQMVVDILQSVDIHIDDTKGNLPAIELIQILKVAISIIHTG